MTRVEVEFDRRMMELALEQARLAGVHGEIPVGAVVTRDNQVIGKGYNLTRRMQDVTLHAEIAAMRQAAYRLGHWYMNDCSVYVTVEPCTQCAGSLLLARMGRLVYGAAEPKFGACGSVNNLVEDSRLNHQVLVVRGVLETECSELMKTFFNDLRAP
ncbi:MAG: nucleoside deaminase [Candidatus Glassbacteria bacterium]|nr:nucleoside deaminase [Candidatus Glassbacteria bacterium]